MEGTSLGGRAPDAYWEKCLWTKASAKWIKWDLCLCHHSLSIIPGTVWYNKEIRYLEF